MIYDVSAWIVQQDSHVHFLGPHLSVPSGDQRYSSGGKYDQQSSAYPCRSQRRVQCGVGWCWCALQKHKQKSVAQWKVKTLGNDHANVSVKKFMTCLKHAGHVCHHVSTTILPVSVGNQQAVMLSGEAASGNFPLEAEPWMKSLASLVTRWLVSSMFLFFFDFCW